MRSFGIDEIVCIFANSSTFQFCRKLVTIMLLTTLLETNLCNNFILPSGCINRCWTGYNEVYFKPWLLLREKLQVCGNIFILIHLGIFFFYSRSLSYHRNKRLNNLLWYITITYGVVSDAFASFSHPFTQSNTPLHTA